MYQLEVKRWLVEHRFPTKLGWSVWVDIDAMERARGGQHTTEKAERVIVAEAALLAMGVAIGGHPEFGRVDVVAEHPEHGLCLAEVEGTSSRQKEQALYSALGQLLLQRSRASHSLLLAVPDEPAWERQVRKIPELARIALGLSCVLVSQHGVRPA